jgi:hypothetical protein
MFLTKDFVSLRAQVVVPWTAPTVRMTRWPGSVDVVEVRRDGVRLGCISLSNASGAAEDGSGYGLLCGCHEGMRLGGPIIERRLVNIVDGLLVVGWKATIKCGEACE